jgi:hypothetical protein
LANPFTIIFFVHLEDERKALLEELYNSIDGQESRIKGRIDGLDDVLDLNKGEMYERIESVR